MWECDGNFLIFDGAAFERSCPLQDKELKHPP